MKKTLSAVIIIGLLLGVGIYYNKSQKTDNTKTMPKIGIITPLVGDVSYWGQSTQKGALLAKKDLAAQGIDIDLFIENGGFDPKGAVNAAQKLVNINKVNAIYSEFNPAAIAVNSFLAKNDKVLHMFMAAITSPLAEKEDAFKSYLDFETSCEQAAHIVQKRGLTNPGVLKMNLEFGELCLKGIKKVFLDVQVQSYNAGDRDLRTPLTQLKSQNVDAVFNISFQPETLVSLKNIHELGMDVQFVGLTEIISPDIVDEYSNLFEGALFFGWQHVPRDFEQRMITEQGSVPNIQAATESYIHIMQIGQYLTECKNDIQCTTEKLNHVPDSELIGFHGFENRMAVFDLLVEEWKDGQLVEVK